MMQFDIFIGLLLVAIAISNGCSQIARAIKGLPGWEDPVWLNTDEEDEDLDTGEK